MNNDLPPYFNIVSVCIQTLHPNISDKEVFVSYQQATSFIFMRMPWWAPKMNVSKLTKQTWPASTDPQTQLLYVHLSSVTTI